VTPQSRLGKNPEKGPPPREDLEFRAQTRRSGAIIFNWGGIRVAIVNDGKAELRKVKVRRDLCTRVEVNSGVKAGDQVILNQPVTLVDGGTIRVPAEAPRT
jgi:hypothetical protein